MAETDSRAAQPSQDLPESIEQLATEIRALTRANRAGRDLEIERRLLQLRYRAGSLMEAGTARATAPSARDEGVPPAADALPEVEPDALTPDRLREAIMGHGSLIVRGLLDRDAATRFAAKIDRAFQQRGRSETDRDPGYYEEFRAEGAFRAPARKWIQTTGGLLVADSPVLAFELIEMLQSTGIAPLAAAYLGDSVALAVEKTTFRRVGPNAEGTWHQDGSFMMAVPSLNVWLSLSDCGVDAPGLDIVPRRLHEIVPTGTDDASFPNQVSHAAVERAAAGRDIATPTFEPGDALLFDELCLHRTTSGASMTRTRHAVESWFFGASSFPGNYSPLALAELGGGRPA